MRTLVQVSVNDEHKDMWLSLFCRAKEKGLITLRPHGLLGPPVIGFYMVQGYS